LIGDRHQRRRRPDDDRGAPWANTLDVTRGIEAALETLRPGCGIEIDVKIFRQRLSSK
jgi:hypothetical protein